jgi:hypothetical protein
MRLIPVVFFTLLATHSGAAESFTLPETWVGQRPGDSAGNPTPAKAPLWRLDRLWPADPAVGSNYEPLPWDDRLGGIWYPLTHCVTWEPRAQMQAGGVLELAMRQSWGDSGDAAGEKIPVLIFIAPKPGTYGVSSELSAQKLGGGGSLIWSLHLRDPQHLDSTRELAHEDLGQAAALTHTLALPSVALQAGQELALVLRSDGFQTLYLLHLSKTTVTLH